MRRMFEDFYWPISSYRCVLEGLISGCFLASSFFIPLGLFVQLILFVIGLLSFIDAIMIVEEDPHIFTVVIFALVSSGVVFFSQLYDLAIYYLLLMVIIGAVFYYLRFFGKKLPFKKRKTEESEGQT